MNFSLAWILLFSLSFGLAAQVHIDHWREAISLARQPAISLEMREKTAQKILGLMREDFALEFKGAKSTDLYKSIVADPEKLMSLIRSNGKYSKLFTDFSRLVAQISAEKVLSNCENYKTYNESIREGLSSYSPCEEGSYSQSFTVLVSKKIGQLKAVNYRIPNFIYSDNLVDLLNASNSLHRDLDEIKASPPLVAGLDQIAKENLETDQNKLISTYAKMEFQEDVYQRSIFNAARNVVSLNVQYGTKELSPDELKQKIASTIVDLCKHCNPKAQKSLTERLSGLIKNQKTNGKLKFYPVKEVTKRFCAKLEKHKYPFYQPLASKDLTGLSLLAGRGKVKIDLYRKERIKVLSEVARSGDEGLLVLTDAMTVLDDEIPDYLKMKCNGSIKDEEIILKAAEEAAVKAGEYAKKLNEELKLTASTKAINDNIKFMLRTNPRSFGEALNESEALAPYACSMLAELKNEDEAHALEEKAWIWGTVVVGTGLSLTGVFAPVGSSMTMAALVAGASVNVAGGIHEYNSALEEKEKSELLEGSTFASGDEKMIVLSQDDYKKYQEAKLSAMINLGLSAIEVASLAKNLIQQERNFQEGVRLLAKKAEEESLELINKAAPQIGIDLSVEIPDLLKLSNQAQIKLAIEELEKNPTYFLRDGKFDITKFKLEAVRPGSAAESFKRAKDWSYKGRNSEFKIPSFKKDVPVTKLDEEMREVFVEVRDVLDTPKDVYLQMQHLEDEVLLESYKSNPNFRFLDINDQFKIKQESLEKVLGAEELRHGFKSTSDSEYRPLILQNKAYNMDEWFKMLQEGQAFNDSAFLPSSTKDLAKVLMNKFERESHGYYTHRIQLYVIMKEIDKNPARFKGIKASELYKKLGDKEFNRKLGLANNPNDTLWQELFDSFDPTYHSPEFFRKQHDDFPELGPWMMNDSKNHLI